jgi:hypothetical protein
MPNETATPETTFGYLAMLESAEHGFFGGYLIVSPLGRPLEFHCTAPVRPSRAQRILYGTTLEPYLLGDQIASALLEVARLKPVLILSGREAALHARSRTNVPMVLYCGNADSPRDKGAQSANSSDRQNASIALRGTATQSASSSDAISIGCCSFQLPLGYESDRDEATRLLAELAQHVDLAEPFDRIEEAIREAQRLGWRGAATNDQAA